MFQSKLKNVKIIEVKMIKPRGLKQILLNSSCLQIVLSPVFNRFAQNRFDSSLKSKLLESK